MIKTDIKNLLDFDANNFRCPFCNDILKLECSNKSQRVISWDIKIVESDFCKYTIEYDGLSNHCSSIRSLISKIEIDKIYNTIYYDWNKEFIYYKFLGSNDLSIVKSCKCEFGYEIRTNIIYLGGEDFKTFDPKVNYNSFIIKIDGENFVIYNYYSKNNTEIRDSKLITIYNSNLINFDYRNIESIKNKLKMLLTFT